MAQLCRVQTLPTSSQESLGAATLPGYSEHPTDMEKTDIEIARLSRTSSSTASHGMNGVRSWAHIGNSTIKSFKCTTQLQIQTRGRPWLMLPFVANSPDPISVWSLHSDGRCAWPVYLSLRPKRRDGSCVLVSGDDATATPLAATSYRFGPGKPPRITMLRPEQSDSQEEFVIESKGPLSRTARIKTSLGTFQWRYAGSKERASEGAHSLLIFERLEDFKGFQKTTKIAQLVRNEEYRTGNTSASTAGNGGRLMLDLSQVGEKHREYLQRLIVATSIVMLKKEMDRRRVHQFIILAAAVGS